MCGIVGLISINHVRGIGAFEIFVRQYAFFFVLLTLCFIEISCSSSTDVKGVVRDKKWRPIEGATITLVGSKDNYKYAEKKTDIEGHFNLLTNNSSNKIEMIFNVTKEGFKPYQLQIVSNNSYNFEVTLESLKPFPEDAPIKEIKSSNGLMLYLPEWALYQNEEINEKAKASHLTNLREIILPDGDIEVRVWAGGDLSHAVSGIVLKRTNNKWQGLFLPPIYSKQKDRVINPLSGWDTFWKKITKEGLLSLPDYTRTGDSSDTDVKIYIVEINMDKTYRTYLYPEPYDNSSDESKHLFKILDIMRQELGVNEHHFRKS